MNNKKKESCLNVDTGIKLLRNTLLGYRSGERNFIVSLLYFCRGLSRKFHFFFDFFERSYIYVEQVFFERKWLKYKGQFAFYDFFGAKLPKCEKYPLGGVFHDVFYFYCLFNDIYSKDLVLKLDSYLNEGAYGYKGDGINVRVEKGDIVIDAGAWIGDFGAYSVAKGGEVYAFEPTSATFDVLCKTAELNDLKKFHPVKKGLGSEISKGFISINGTESGGNSISFKRSNSVEQIELTTIDSFVKENNLPHVDFIKADIEGYERYMLLGARETLKKYAPKLAICTYHYPDDPQVLENIVLEANPNYKIVHLNKKMLAQIV